MKSLLTLIFILLLGALAAQSLTMPANDVFYNPNIKSYNKTIAAPTAATDHSTLIQEAIDDVAHHGGGILTINANKKNSTYIINKEVLLRSGVHIRVSPNVIFTTTSLKRITMFSAGKREGKVISNISLSCTDDDLFFLFDYSHRKGGKGSELSVIALSLGGVTNFRVADFKVKDNFTPMSAITMNLLDFKNGKYAFPKDGIVEHLEIRKGHYGYGLVQCQASTNVLFRDLKGEGGATLRLETGAIGKPYLTDKSLMIDQVYGKGIYCERGQAAITLSPHTIINGEVFIDDLTAISCEAGAIIASGFLSAKKGQKDENGNAVEGYSFGSFDSNSVISNLKVVYGTEAQLRPSRRAFVPCSQRYLVHNEINIDGESYQGPTITPIMYYAKGGTDAAKGFYTVKMPGLVVEGFPLVDGVMENKEFISSSKEAINDCDITWGKGKTPKGKKKK